MHDRVQGSDGPARPQCY